MNKTLYKAPEVPKFRAIKALKTDKYIIDTILYGNKIDRDAPDCLFKKDNICVIVEAFKISAYIKRKDNKLHMSIKAEESKFIKNTDSNKSIESKVLTEKEIGKYRLENILQSFKVSWYKHTENNKFKTYIQNVKKDENLADNIEFIRCIFVDNEDFIDEQYGDKIVKILFNYTEILEIIQDTPDVDCVIYKDINMKEAYIISKEDIKDLLIDSVSIYDKSDIEHNIINKLVSFKF